VTADLPAPGGRATPTLATLRRARAQQQAVDSWLRILRPILIIIWAVTCLHGNPGAGLHGRSLALSLALAGFVASGLAAFALWDRVGFWYIACSATLLASSIGLVWLEPGVGVIGLFAGLLMLGRRMPRRVAIGVRIAAFILLAVIEVINSGGGSTSTLFALIVFAGFFGMMFLASRLGEAIEQAERLLVELAQAQGEQERAAALAERQRLAREMHDVLAHSLSGLMLQLEGARMLAVQVPGNERLAEVIEHAHHLARSGLDEARGAIGMLRDEELPGPERLATLAAEFQQDRGVPCRFTVSGSAHELGSQARLAVYRVAQEALTNITKHAKPERVELTLAYEPDGTSLRIEDFVSADAEPDSASQDGYGLTGMRERAELLGGQLTTATTGSGFLVELRVPS
jgi:signal transduction histidine kinase